MIIYKYPLDLAMRQTIRMPKGARILSVQDQQGQLCLWAMVDLENTLEKRMFSIYGTGQGFSDDPGKYIGTVQQKGGAFIWHVFEDEEF